MDSSRGLRAGDVLRSAVAIILGLFRGDEYCDYHVGV